MKKTFKINNKWASESPKATESGLMAEAAGAAMPTRNAVYRHQPSSEPKTNFIPFP